MYHKGDLVFDTLHYDTREDDGYDSSYKYYDKKVAMLPHSCDQWIIGGREEILVMIDDLTNLLQEPKS